MPSPIVHGATGLALGLSRRLDDRARRISTAVLVLAACAPDADFIPGFLLGDLTRFHHGAAHSAAAAMIVGVTIGVVGRISGAKQARYLGVLAGLAALGHVLLDMVSTDEGIRLGVPFLWPLSTQRVALPFALFVSFRREASGPFLRAILTRHNAYALLVEVIVVAAAAVVLFVLARLGRAKEELWQVRVDGREGAR